MNLSEYFKIKPRGHRLELAEKIGCNPTYLSHISTGIRIPSPTMSIKIECATAGIVSRYDLRNDAVIIWGTQKCK